MLCVVAALALAACSGTPPEARTAPESRRLAAGADSSPVTAAESAREPSRHERTQLSGRGAVADASGAAPGEQAEDAASTDDAEPAGDRDAGPLLVYEAEVTLAVYNVAEALDAIEDEADERGGYLVRRTTEAITIRVPAPAFRETLAAAVDLGDELGRDVSVRDVTEEFRDLEARLDNLRAVRQRLAALLDRADSIEEALQVENELERVTGEIEQLEGQLEVLRELIQFSTIRIVFQAQPDDTPVEDIDPRVTLPFDWLDDLTLGQLLDLESN